MENNENIGNISSCDLDSDTQEKLRGDAIGDTLYSQSFVLKTLLQFSDVEWNEETEDNLCFLWDMTLEPAVCKYLFELSFPSIACSAIEKYEEPRFIEITIGILANILCADCGNKNIEVTDIVTILNELNTDDHLILIQIVRLIRSLAFNFEKLQFIDDKTIEKLVYILSNSTNTDLLLETLEAVSKIVQDFKINPGLINIDLYNASFDAIKTFWSLNEILEINTSVKNDSIKFVLEIITNICGYINEYDISELLIQVRRSESVLSLAINIFEYFAKEDNLFPISDYISFYMSAFTYIFPIIKVKFSQNLFVYSLDILKHLKNCEHDAEDVLKPLLELIHYQIFIGDNKDVLDCFSNLKQGKIVFNHIRNMEQSYEYNIAHKLMYIKNKLKF